MNSGNDNLLVASSLVGYLAFHLKYLWYSPFSVQCSVYFISAERELLALSSLFFLPWTWCGRLSFIKIWGVLNEFFSSCRILKLNFCSCISTIFFPNLPFDWFAIEKRLYPKKRNLKRQKRPIIRALVICNIRSRYCYALVAFCNLWKLSLQATHVNSIGLLHTSLCLNKKIWNFCTDLDLIFCDTL